MGRDVQRDSGAAFLRTVRFRQVVFASITIVAGLTGLLLLAVPASTERFFSWGLAPSAVASLVGGLYLASAIAFAIAIPRVRVASRAFCLMSIVFTLPTLIITLAHLDVFDFGRLQAWLWLVLFAGAPFFFVILLMLDAWRGVGSGLPMASWARAVLFLVTITASSAAILLLVDPPGSAAWLPFEPPPLGGRFVGVWSAVVAFTTGWSAFRPAEEARVMTAAAALLVAGALAAAVRSFAELESSQRVGYLVALAAAVAVLLLLLKVDGRDFGGTGG